MKKWACSLAVAVLVGSACGPGEVENEAVDAVPAFEDVSMEVTEEGALEGRESVSQGLSADGGTEVPEPLQHARDRIRALNERVRAALQPIRELLAELGPRMEVGDVRVLGPRDHGTATYRLTVKKLAEARYGWILEAKALGSADDAYERVAGGRMARLENGTIRRGTFGVNLTRMSELDEEIQGTGQVLAGFAVRPEGKTVVYALKEFSPDVVAHPNLLNEIFSGFRLSNGITRVRFAGEGNVTMPGGTDAEEFLRSILRHVPGVGGRADARIVGGDVPSGTFRVRRACWNAAGENVSRILLECAEATTAPSPSTCTVLVKEPPAGELGSLCPLALRPDAAPSADGAAGAEDGAPDADVIPPTELPGLDE